MKKYKLLKELPGCRKGATLTLFMSCLGFDSLVGKQVFDDMAKYPDWFEEIKSVPVTAGDGCYPDQEEIKEESQEGESRPLLSRCRKPQCYVEGRSGRCGELHYPPPQEKCEAASGMGWTDEDGKDCLFTPIAQEKEGKKSTLGRVMGCGCANMDHCICPGNPGGFCNKFGCTGTEHHQKEECKHETGITDIKIICAHMNGETCEKCESYYDKPKQKPSEWIVECREEMYGNTQPDAFVYAIMDFLDLHSELFANSKHKE